ncbi:MAG: hypothetical protein A2527_03930 [Candidatus Lambdaproteobacteria bacterium RIFOXYD2_FULL_50_16]|uniref:Peptidase S24/S26A/S26B/S26C domain-containing protein n=1 Tax=Candidatus Lambdaproteobacteria bacterium RIFOXYD2_FULL_50_16 TaxID=1817772 RepID=A0A1F6GF19_9PROT|nr:MAG: hypothetical protein A2527_03930 [Candidatus Lambdaproteobacteria bacterium RIFOXYD2_FULL_50_16]
MKFSANQFEIQERPMLPPFQAPRRALRSEPKDPLLDLNRYLVPKPESSFMVKVVGDSMVGAGIYHDDLLVVDRAQEARSGMVVVVAFNGELAVKRLVIDGESTYIEAAAPGHPTLEVTDQCQFKVWGVVQWVLHQP